VRWKEDGDTVNPRIVTVMQDTTFTALFASDTMEIFPVTVRVSEQSEEMGSVVGTAPYIRGEQAVLRAVAERGHHFVRWEEDGDTKNPRTVTVMQDTTFTAYFETGASGSMTAELAASGVVLYPNPVRSVLHLRSTVPVERICIYNLNGQQVKFLVSPGREVNVSDLPRGLYFVRLITADGNETVRKLAKE
jgi:hypothetical protein